VIKALMDLDDNTFDHLIRSWEGPEIFALCPASLSQN